MKKLVALAALFAAFTFTACDKDDDKKDDNNNNSGNKVELKDNQLQYDNLICNLTETHFMICDGRGYLDATDPEAGVSMIGDIESNAFGKTVTLAEAQNEAEYFISVRFQLNGQDYSISFQNHNGINGNIGEDAYDGESIFKSGTISFGNGQNGMTINFDGIMKNDQHVAGKINIAQIAPCQWELQ